MDAEIPAAQDRNAPHENDPDGDGRFHISSCIQGHDHAHIHSPADFQEDVHEKDHLAQGMDFRILRKEREDSIAVGVDQDGQAAGKEHGNQDGKFDPFVHFPVIVRSFEIADQDLGGHGQGLGIEVADHSNDVGVDLGGDHGNAEQVHEGHDGGLGQLVRKGFPSGRDAQVQQLAQGLAGERAEMGERKSQGGLFVENVYLPAAVPRS